MSVGLDLAILAGSVAALLALVALVHWAGRRLGWSAEVQRKTVHVAVGLYALALPLLFDARWPVILLLLIALALMLVLRLPASRSGGLGAAIHSVERRSAGDIWLVLAIGFIFVRAGDDYILYALPIAVIALSDAAAALTGSTYGRLRFAIEDGVKSWEGVIAFFAVTLIVSMVMLLLLTDVPRVNVVVLALVIAAFSAVVEAVSWRGLDNLFVPVCIHFFLAGYIGADPGQLAILAAIFFTTVLAVALVSPRLRLSVHASRAFVIAIFFFLGVSGSYGTVLPLLVIAAHLVARRFRPCLSRHADLDFIAALCGVGLIWYFVGETVGASAINLYNVSLAGLLLGYLFLALAVDWRWAIPAYLLVLGAFVALIQFAPPYALWVEGLLLIAAGSLALVVVALLVRAHWYDRWRAARLAATASLVPFTAYLAQTVLA